MGAKRLFSEAANAISFRATLSRRTASGLSTKTSVCTADQSLDPLPPFLEREDVCAVDQRLEATRPQRCIKPVGKGHVLAAVGDEYLGL